AGERAAVHPHPGRLPGGRRGGAGPGAEAARRHHRAGVTSAVAAGLGLGFITAAQVGPIWLLCLRSTLRGGFRVGVAIGAGAAVFSAASTASIVGSSRAAALVLVGAVCAGSFVWFVLLSAGTAAGRRYVGPRLVAGIDAVSALAIVGFAGLLGWRTLS